MDGGREGKGDMNGGKERGREGEREGEMEGEMEELVSYHFTARFCTSPFLSSTNLSTP